MEASVSNLNEERDTATLIQDLGIDVEFSAFSQSLADVLDTRLDDENAFDRFMMFLKREPSYAAKILSVVNSAAYAGKSPITNLRAALTRLGTAATRNFLLSVAITDQLSASKPLLVHSVATAAFARRLSKAAQIGDPEEMLCAGLIHDIGKLVLLRAGKVSAESKTVLGRGGPEILADERAVFGVDHLEAGAYFARLWGLPQIYLDVIQNHHNASAESSWLLRIVSMADEWTQNFYSHDFSKAPNLSRVIEWAQINLGLSRATVLEIIEQVPEDVALLTQHIGGISFDTAELIRTLQRANLALGEVNGMAELLRAQTQQQIRQLGYLQELSSVSSTAVGQRQLCESVVALTSRRLGLRVVSLMLRNATGRLYLESAIGLPTELVGNPLVECSGPVSNWVVANKEGLLLSDVTKSPEFRPSAFADRYSTNSLLSVPIAHGTDVLGVLNVNNKYGDTTFNEDDLSLFETVGRNLGALLHVERERARRERADQRFRSLAAKTPVALVGFDLQGNVWLWNHGAHVLTGIAPSEALGSRIPSVLLPGNNPDLLARWIAEVRDGHSIDREESVLIGPDQELQYILYSVFPLDGNTLGVWSGANITREKVAQLSAQRRSAEIEATQHVLREVLLELQAPSVLSNFVEHLSRATGVEKAAVLLLQEDSDNLYCAAHHGFGPAFRSGEWQGAMQSLVSQSIDGRTLVSNVPLTESQPVKQFLTNFGVRNLASAPIVRQGKVVGVVCVYNRRTGNFEGVDLPVIQDMANVAAIALQVSDTHAERVRSEQLRTVAGMAVTYNHNVNNSLQVIQSEIDLTYLDQDLTPSVRKALMDIESAAQRIAQVNERLRMIIQPSFREYASGVMMVDVGALSGNLGTNPGQTAH